MTAVLLHTAILAAAYLLGRYVIGPIIGAILDRHN